MSNNFILVACTSIGRSIILEILKKKKLKKQLRLIINLNNKRGKKKSNYDSYRDLKKKYKLPIKYVNNINSKKTLSLIRKIKPELIIQSGWSAKFSDELLKIPKFGCIGQHPAPLPIGRGAACVNWAIIKGYRTWGDSFFIMDNEYDNGDIISQKKFKIGKKDTVKVIYEKVSKSTTRMFLKNIKNWTKGKFKRKKQIIKNQEYFRRRKPEDGRIDLNFSPLMAYNYVRALTYPYPGAFIYHKKVKFYIWEAKLTRSLYLIKKFKNSKKLFVFYKNKLYLNLYLSSLKNHFIEIISLQKENEKKFSILDFYKKFYRA